MNIDKLIEAYSKESEFITPTSINEYASNLHTMLVKEKDFEKVYNSTRYKDESQQICADFDKLSLSELTNYEEFIKSRDK